MRAVIDHGQVYYSNANPNGIHDTYKVFYVGRSIDPARRFEEHKRDLKKQIAGLKDYRVIFTGLTINQARLCEQVLISAYSIECLENARREIAQLKVGSFASEMNRLAQLQSAFSEDEIYHLIFER